MVVVIVFGGGIVGVVIMIFDDLLVIYKFWINVFVCFFCDCVIVVIIVFGKVIMLIYCIFIIYLCVFGFLLGLGFRNNFFFCLILVWFILFICIGCVCVCNLMINCCFMF